MGAVKLVNSPKICLIWCEKVPSGNTVVQQPCNQECFGGGARQNGEGVDLSTQVGGPTMGLVRSPSRSQQKKS